MPALAMQALEIAAQQFQDAGAPLDLEWGALARFRMGTADQPGWGGGDPAGVFASMLFLPAPDGALEGYLGETFIALVEFGEQLQAKVLLAYGNSSRPNSPHNGDQVVLISNKQMRDPAAHQGGGASASRRCGGVAVAGLAARRRIVRI